MNNVNSNIRLRNSKKNNNKNLNGTIYEWISFILFLIVSGYAFNEHNAKELLTWGGIPLVPFIISIFYRSDEIGKNIKNIGLGLGAMIYFLDNHGINGLPAFSFFVLIIMLIANYFTAEKVLTEMIKVVGGIVTGSLIQAKIPKN